MDLSGLKQATTAGLSTPTAGSHTARVIRADSSGIWAVPLGEDTAHPIGPCRGTAEAGDLVVLVITDEQPWVLTGESGSDPGPPGPPNTLTAGTIDTGPPGSSASFSITGDAPDQTLNLTLPRGDVGPAGAGVITGVMQMWPVAAAPAGYLLCNGGTFSSATYPALATLLGDTYGTHAGAAYYLPDFRGRGPLGTGTASPAVAGGTAHTLGQKGGEEKHAQTVAEMPGHTHSTPASNTTGSSAGVHDGSGNLPASAPAWPGTQVTVTTSSVGSGTAFNVLSPFLGINFIIKT